MEKYKGRNPLQYCKSSKLQIMYTNFTSNHVGDMQGCCMSEGLLVLTWMMQGHIYENLAVAANGDPGVDKACQYSFQFAKKVCGLWIECDKSVVNCGRFVAIPRDFPIDTWDCRIVNKGAHSVPAIISLCYDSRIATPIYGYVLPFFFLISLIVNTPSLIILLTRAMRTPSNLLLVGIALANLLMGLSTMPIGFYIYSSRQVFDWLQYNLCHFALGMHYAPVVFHRICLLLTMSLGVLRMMTLTRPHFVKKWVNNAKIVCLVVCIYILSLLAGIRSCLFYNLIKVDRPSIADSSIMITSCMNLIKECVHYFKYRLTVEILFRLIPGLVLVMTNAVLIHLLFLAKKHQLHLVASNQRKARQIIKESNRNTLMLVIIVGMFIVFELPLVVMSVLRHVEEHPKSDMDALHEQCLSSSLQSLFIQIIYSIDIMIYCAMSQKFRDSFKAFFMDFRPPKRSVALESMSFNTRQQVMNAPVCPAITDRASGIYAPDHHFSFELEEEEEVIRGRMGNYLKLKYFNIFGKGGGGGGGGHQQESNKVNTSPLKEEVVTNEKADEEGGNEKQDRHHS